MKQRSDFGTIWKSTNFSHIMSPEKCYGNNAACCKN